MIRPMKLSIPKTVEEYFQETEYAVKQAYDGIYYGLSYLQKL
jgi:hypothetical protein